MHQLKTAILSGPAIVLVAIVALTRSIPDLSIIAPYLIGAALTTTVAVIWFNGR